jgi:putative tryptophan/tyrosine transport system substrate-binding protein
VGVRSRYYQQQVVDIEVKSRLLGDLPKNGIYGAGGVMYGAKTPDLLQCAATYVDKILKDAKPDDLPVQQPKPFEPTSI